MRRQAAIILALGMLTTVPLGVGLGDHASLASVAPKLDDPLYQYLSGNPEWTRWTTADGHLRLILIGAPVAMPDAVPTDRVAAMAYLEAQAAPFFDEVRAALRPGDTITHTFAAVPEVVALVKPEHVTDLAALPSVARAGLDWSEAVHITDLPSEGPGLQMAQSVPLTQAPDVWAEGYRGEGVKVAMIDTGIAAHDMMLDYDGTSRVAAWRDVTVAPGGSGYCENPCDTNGHGTHTTGTAVGSAIAGGRYEGMAGRATIFGVRIFQGGSGTWEVAQAGLQASFDMGSDLTSNSWGGGCGNAGSEATTTLARNLANMGMLSVFAIGNSGSSPSSFICPGREDLVLSVGATDKNKVIAGFSSRGPCNDTPTGPKDRICPDVVAVGVNVDSSYTGGGYSSLSGTSMATPHVAGAAALMFQMKRAQQGSGWSTPTKQLEDYFKALAQDLGAAGPDNSYGHGFIQLRPMRDGLDSTATARVAIGVSLSRAEMRNADTNTATITLTNVGGKAVSGTVNLVGGGQLFHDGHDFGSQAVSLAPGQSTTVTLDVSGAGLFPTIYHLIADYAYTWDNNGSPVSATIGAQANFLLRGVYLTAGREFQGVNATLQVQQVTLRLVNLGNEPATSLVLTEGVPLGGYVVSPRGPSVNPLAVFSNPAPDSVGASLDNATFTMTYNLPPLAPNAPSTVDYAVRNLAPGTYQFVAYLTYKDGADLAYNRYVNQDSKVCPLLLPC